jgi:hypothetical protein
MKLFILAAIGFVSTSAFALPNCTDTLVNNCYVQDTISYCVIGGQTVSAGTISGGVSCQGPVAGPAAGVNGKRTKR